MKPFNPDAIAVAPPGFPIIIDGGLGGVNKSMLTSTGDINEPYAVIGVVHASAARTPEKAGCGKPALLPTDAAYHDATIALVQAAMLSEADAVIHIGYDHRMATKRMGCNEVQPAFEVYAWGTAVKLG